ncbi:DUF485 domain-containing protein [Streptomyces sp. NPDC058417]|uniref:DUF485 domain-containing protein n=1 Tax=unclassified Streptomyces TaxID=2593676 RepID=UPI003649BA06
MSYGDAQPQPHPLPPGTSPPLPGTSPPLSSLPVPLPPPSAPAWAPAPGAVPGRQEDLRRLRRAYRRQRRVTTFLALGYFTVFLYLSAREPALMARPLPGGLPLGPVLALSHVPVTWLAVVVYERTARRYVDPLARRVNQHASWAADVDRGRAR